MKQIDNSIILGDSDLIYGANIKSFANRTVYDFEISQDQINKSDNIVYIDMIGRIEIFKKKHG